MVNAWDRLTADEKLASAFAAKGWGWFRALIARKPLLGFWSGVGLGAVIGDLAAHVLAYL